MNNNKKNRIERLIDQIIDENQEIRERSIQNLLNKIEI